LHGATDTHNLWDPFVPDLSKSFRVITPDSRGHGRTDNPSGELSYELLADDLGAIILALDLDRPFVFGYSDGGQAALDFGMRYPDLAGRLILGGVWYRFSKQYQAAISAAGFVSPGIVDWIVYQQQAPPDWFEHLRTAHPNPDPEYPRTLLKALAKLWWTPLYYSKEDFLKIRVPTLVLMGEKDEIIPVDEGRELVELIPGAEISVIPGASHAGVFKFERELLNILQGFFNPPARLNSPDTIR
ncbi:MAG: alpha/beta fold hydrolase, partial [Anaerolineales bacterium]|nr:alpha/beta fold hydrolase [Anaerolineales bacterium]